MLKITVSGVRGIVPESLTPKVALEFGQAFGTFAEGSKVIVGRDTRTTGRLLKNALVCGLVSCGCEVVDIGICPTPTVLLMSRKTRRYGVIITASHNPARWNGLKFVKRGGVFLNKREMKTLADIYGKERFRVSLSDCKEVGSAVTRFYNADDIHIEAVLKNIDTDSIKAKRFKVACDFCNGAGAVITKKFLRALGCRVYAINDTPDGKFAHNPEPKPEHLKALSGLVRRHKADIGLAQDPDADRLALCDEKGVLISEENTLALAVECVLEKGSGSVVVNVSTSSAIDDIAKRFGARIYRTAVGETNVVEKMIQVRAAIGGEGNGGVIYPKINLCRDSLVGVGIILEYLAKTGKRLSRLAGRIARYSMIKKKLDYPAENMELLVRKLKSKYKNKKLDSRDGIKIIWPTGWVHVRPSNTEPIVRLIAEAKTDKEARRLYRLVRGDIARLGKKRRFH